ncbi:EMILIN-2-like isoform X2 [Ruditapes philippinarum]|uniref:EMILIN-2-like isoform X2 n=1 Tax=Ruditapes philippinarum TaxID=129788 RepID=UPI00295B9B88|nr:EMILIN-2-like isoform X2 [Ruditapes philippinarum]
MYLMLTILGLLVIQRISCSEPQCSRFHYEEQTLLKMLKLELFVEKMKEDIQSTQQKVLETLQSLDKEKNGLKQDYQEMKERDEAVMLRYAQEVENLKESAKRPTIIFQSKGLINLSPSAGETLVFKTTMLNEGNGYNNSTGVFTAPAAGVYLFTIQLCAHSKHDAQYIIMAEDKEIQRGFFYDTESNSCGTANGLTVLKEGHRVRIKMQYSRQLMESTTAWNTFSGVLLHTY